MSSWTYLIRVLKIHYHHRKVQIKLSISWYHQFFNQSYLVCRTKFQGCTFYMLSWFYLHVMFNFHRIHINRSFLLLYDREQRKYKILSKLLSRPYIWFLCIIQSKLQYIWAKYRIIFHIAVSKQYQFKMYETSRKIWGFLLTRMLRKVVVLFSIIILR